MASILGVLIAIVGIVVIFGGIFADNIFPFNPSTATYQFAGIVIGSILAVIGGVIGSMGGQGNFRPDNKTLKIADHHPCPVCGKEDYTWGVVGGPQAARFRLKMLGPIWSGKPIMARTCDNCGHLSLFIKPERP